MGFLGVRFEVGGSGGFVLRWGGGGGGGGGVKLPPCLKLVRIMLETSNLARKYTPICSFRKYTF